MRKLEASENHILGEGSGIQLRQRLGDIATGLVSGWVEQQPVLLRLARSGE
jgi:hypothetical protein